MSGDIGVDCQPGVSSIFWFELTLPLGSAADADSDPSHDLLTDLRVVVVDDNATNRTILESQLLSWRMQPELVENANSALTSLRAAAADGHPYDLAVLELCMPDTDGLQLITEDPALHGILMIILFSSLRPDPPAFAEAGVRQ